MGLEKILERIRAAGEQQADDIVKQAEAEACAILEQARKQANDVYQEALREAQQPTEGECARLLNGARFEGECIIGQAREHFIDAVLESLQERLARVRESDEYAQALHKHVLEVLPPENGQAPLRERILLEADPRDAALLSRILLEAGLDIEVRGALECLGGVNAYAAGRGVRVMNTIDSRLERALPYLRRALARRFEELATRAGETIPAEQAGAS